MDNNEEIISCFNELVGKLSGSAINLDYVLEFITIFRSSDVNWYYQYVNKVHNMAGNFNTKELVSLVGQYLGYSSVDTHEIEIASFITNNLIVNGYYYHVTNNYGLNNIQENGFGIEGKREMNEDLLRVYNLLSPKSQLMFFKGEGGLKNLDEYSLSTRPNTSAYYGSVPEWFYIVTGCTTIDDQKYSMVMNDVVNRLKNNNESEEAIKGVVSLVDKYWNIFKNNTSRKLIMIPNNVYSNFQLENLLIFKDRIENDLSGTMDFFIHRFFLDGNNIQYNTYVSPDKLIFLNCDDYKMYTSTSTYRK